MLALLGSLLGFLGSLVPEGLKIFQDSRDKKHELEIMKLQMDMQQRGIDNKLEEIHVNAMAAQVNALQQSYRAELKYSGKYSASVRPTITYAFMAAFILFKFALLYSLMHPTLPWQTGVTMMQGIAMIWGEEETALFAGVVSFWFGSRQISRGR